MLRRFCLPCFCIVLAAIAASLALMPGITARTERQPWRAGDAVRVGAPEPVRQATIISPYGPGFEAELIDRFCREAACEVQWVTVADRKDGLGMLRSGDIDILVGFWGGVPAPAHEDASPPLAGGKAYAHFNPVRIAGAAAPRDSRAARDAEEPASFLPEIFGRAFTFLKPLPGEARAANETALPFPVFSLLQDGGDDPEKDILLLDPASYVLWLPFLGDVKGTQVQTRTPYRWFWRNDDSALAASLEKFWAVPARKAELAELTERYFGFLPHRLRQRDILELTDTLTTRLPGYEDFIMQAARETGVPPLLLVATIYQESRFDPDAVSATRVRGIMQLTTATARMLGVDRKDPEECILGGARYLRDLFDQTEGKASGEWDRWFMALAAYNQGMSNLNRTIRLSRELGSQGDTWADLKRAFPRSTTCRGLEARSFVEKIRFYHFILHGLVALAPAETQDFAPLLGLALADGSF